MFTFEVIKQNSKGRVCLVKTPHGEFLTPSFYFCGTHGAIKCNDTMSMMEEKTQTILSNTFSLLPFSDTIQKQGGIHKFIGWNKPMLTDSGGYQVFSMGYGSVSQEIKGKRNRKSFVKKITEEGVMFRSPINGDDIFLSPEVSIQTQYKIGADFVVSFDECTPFNISGDYTKKSMERSHRWETRSLIEFEKINNPMQRLYGVVQGGVFPQLRKESCDFVNKNNFFGVAIGGCLGKDKLQMYDITSFTLNNLEKNNRPIHLLGIGDVDDIRKFVPLGIDTFDCVSPTRLARHGVAIIRKGNLKLKLNNACYVQDSLPLDSECGCFTCINHSRSYIHYLLKRKEPLAALLLTRHNVRQMNDLFTEIREDILNS
jgi:queuine tRNA-ribosyltransferase